MVKYTNNAVFIFDDFEKMTKSKVQMIVNKNKTGFVWLLFFLVLVVNVKATKLQSAYEALFNKDYFKAMKLFNEINKKKPDAYSCFGLATIYSRNDNPYSNPDSASKYISQSYYLFKLLEKPIKIKGLQLDTSVILNAVDSIADRQFQQIKKESSVEKYDRFLRANYLASQSIIIECFYARDETEFNNVQLMRKSEATQNFIVTHPQSNFLLEALLLLDRQIFEEKTKDQSANSYVQFLKKYPKSTLKNVACDKLFEIYKQTSDLEGLKKYVVDYPSAPQNLEAWKMLFSLFVRSYTNSELKKFLENYPAFPLKNSILKEVELNNIALIPYQQKELTGFVNGQGKLIIPNIYDSVTDFQEGLSVVSKNDSVFFINKENTNVFSQSFAEAFGFKNGIAAVKKNNKWYFINRLGQQISKFYDEISEQSNEVYVVKLNEKYGALDRYCQPLIETKYTKLGDFKNEFAYYIEDNKYGFVSKAGTQHKAEFDWISDFSDKQIAVVKKEDKYGLLSAKGKKILNTVYDLIIKANNDVYIVVLNNSYCFFSSEGCFLSQLAYDYAKDKPADYYTNGDCFKLIKKGQQSLVGRNGHTLIAFESFDEINFFSEGKMRVSKNMKKENKYGFLDKNLKAVIPLKYKLASDFVDSIALAESKEKFIMLNHQGLEIFTSDHPIQKLTTHYYLLNDGYRQLLNDKGKIVFSDIADAQVVNPWLLIVTLADGEIKLLYD